MEEVERALLEQIAEGPRESPVSPVEAAEAARSSRRIRLLLALTPDEVVLAEWARSTDYDRQDRFGRAALLRAGDEEIDRAVDGRLAEGHREETIDLLARCGVPWSHDAIEGDPEEGETGRAASIVLARSTPGELRRRSMECEVVDDVVEMLRAAAVTGVGELWDQFLIWHGRLEEVDGLDEELRETLRARLEGVGAVLDPTLFGRGLLRGDYGSRWLGDSRSVADLLQAYGPSDWLEVAATLEEAGGSGVELASTLGVSAALGTGERPPNEDEIERLLALLAEEPQPNQKESPWESKAAELGFGFQLALGGEEFGLLLAQAAAHERLATHGVHSPGVRGLPLSATGREHLDPDAVREVVGELAEADGESEQMSVAAVRTLYDAVVWARRGGEEIEELAAGVADAFESTSRASIEVARAHLRGELHGAHRRWEGEQFAEESTLPEAMVLSSGESDAEADRVIEELSSRAASSETLTALDCIRRIGGLGVDRNLEALGDLWLHSAPVYRAPFARRVLEEAIAVEVRSEE